MKMKFSVLTAVALLFASKAHSYSHNGHYLVGAIADQMLAGTPTAGKIKKLIGTVNLATAANIPDEIRAWDPDVTKSTKPFKVTKNKKLNSDLKGFLAANQTSPDCSGELMHQEYHFTDIEVLNSPKYSAGQVGTNEHDIVHMIGFCIDVLTGKQSADNPEWHLDKAQNFVAQAFASAGVRPAFKEDSAGGLLHFLDRFPKVAFVFHRLAEGFKLLAT